MHPPVPPVNEGAIAYLDLDDLLALGLSPYEAAAVLRHSYITGHDRRAVVDASASQS